MFKRKNDDNHATQSKKQKRDTKFHSDWNKEYTWVQKSEKGEGFMFCSACKCNVSVKAGGMHDLKMHQATLKHQRNIKSIQSTPTVASLFTPSNVDKVTKAELLFSNFVAEHNLPFLVADHFTELVKVMFPDSDIAKKFKCKRTKTTHIVTEALAPCLDEKVSEQCKTNTFSILVDESNDAGGEKSVAVLVRVFDQKIRRIATRFLDLPTCNIGTGLNIFNCLDEILV